VSCELEITKRNKQPTLRKNLYGQVSFLTIEGTYSTSSQEYDLLHRIPVMLRQQQCCNFASALINVITSWFRELEIQCAAFGVN
jgi:hypothetical protein